MSVSILPNYSNMKIEMIAGEASPIQITFVSQVTIAPCPRCGTPSARVRGTYQRTLGEIPSGTVPVEIRLTVHRFRCDVPACAQTIFCERVPWAPVYHRRTLVCLQRILSLAWEMSASAAQRVAAGMGIPVSRSTINRWLIRTADNPLPDAGDAGGLGGSDARSEPLIVVGIDDWAWKKGQRYGTVVVDLEKHQPVDVLPDRAADTVAAWLRQHPTIQVISRDRGGTYARGAREGAPKAQQVADRFHLLKNWHDHTAALIGPWNPPSPDPVPIAECPETLAMETVANPQDMDDTPIGAAASPRKQARWEAVHRLWDQGLSITAIAKQVHCDPKTVRKDIAAVRPRAAEPPRHRPDPGENQLLAELWHGQRPTAQELWDAAQKQGYTKSVASVSRWLRQRRGSVQRGRRPAKPRDPASEGSSPPPAKKPWTGRQWAHFLGMTWHHLPRRTTNILSQRLAEDPLYRKTWTLTRHFHTLIAHRRGEQAVAAWCRAAEASGIGAFGAFAKTLRQDWEAVVAGVTVEWSQGPVEGFNTRTKLLKRMMYGRANLPLLRARILHR